MNSYRKLNIPNFEQCDKEIKAAYNSLHANGAGIKYFWTYEDNEKFFNQCPTLVDSFKQMGVTVQHAFVITVSTPDENVIHVDHDSNPVRINWPLTNMQSIVTRWYKSNDPGKLLMENPHGGPYVRFEPEDVEQIDQCVLDGPTAIRVDIPHNTTHVPGMPLPRTAYSFNFLVEDIPRMMDIINGL